MIVKLFHASAISNEVENEPQDVPAPTNKDRLCERSEPQSYPVVDEPDIGTQLAIRKYLFLERLL